MPVKKTRDVYGDRKAKPKRVTCSGSQDGGGGAPGVEEGVQCCRAADMAFKLTNGFLYLKSRYMGAYNDSWNCNMFFCEYSQLFEKQSAHPLITTTPQKGKSKLSPCFTYQMVYILKAGKSKDTSDYFPVFSFRIPTPLKIASPAFSLEAKYPQPLYSPGCFKTAPNHTCITYFAWY